jgi:Na+-transporting methylmalonyl-CoA/oxaloacetate decarboxylase beta subunit
MTALMLIIIIQLFIIKALTQQPEDQLQAQQEKVRENT